MKDCEHPQCQAVEEIILNYDLRNLQTVKKDPVLFIVKYYECEGYVRTNCPVGSEINNKMLETHRLLKNHVL